MRILSLVLAAALVLLFAVCARGETQQCARAFAMVDELHDATADLENMKALYAQVCAERPKRRECIAQRVEIRAYEAELRQLERETLAALRSCNSERATRKASAECYGK